MDKAGLLQKGRHPAFTPPDDVDVKLWRYMDLTWFLELLKKALARYGLKVPVRQSDLAADPLY